MTFQVVTIGETMLRLTPTGGRPMEGSDLWSVDVAGAESNVAVTLARLGVPTGWVSRLPDSPLGRKVAGALRQHGVDTSRVVWAADGRQGLYFLDPGIPPRAAAITYDRSYSAFSLMEPSELDLEYVRSARIVHLTGITPALGAGPRRLVHEVIDQVHAAGNQIAFDVNYRSALWRPDEARALLEPVLQKVDLLIIGAQDLSLLFPELAGEGEEAALERLSGRFRPRAAVLTCGEDGALALADGVYHRRPAVAANGVDRVGRGDAFAAGFLYGYLEGSLDRALAYGTALAALKMTYHGDFPWITPAELQRVMDEGPVDIVR